MNICRLCLTADANKTGSHIIPHFILRNIDNEEKSKSRSKELGFSISDYYDSGYIGSAVLPESIEEVHGDIDLNKIKKMKSPLIRDYIFCNHCEERISLLESEYSNQLRKKPDFKAKQIAIDGGAIPLLFWLSIFWRLTLDETQSLRLEKKESSRIQRVLNKYLRFNTNEIDHKSAISDSDILTIGYKIMRAYDFTKENPTVLFPSQHHSRPYCLIIDEFVVYLYMNTKYAKQEIFTFFGSEKILAGKKINIMMEDSEITYLVAPEEFEVIMTNVYSYAAKVRNRSHRILLDQLYSKLGGQGKHMPERIKDEILAKIHFDEEHMGSRYSLGRFAEVSFEVLRRYVK